MNKEKFGYTVVQKMIIIFATTSSLVLVFLAGFYLTKYFNLNNNAKKNSLTRQVFDANNALSKLKTAKSEYNFPDFDYQKSSYKPNIPSYEIDLSELKNMSDFEVNKDNSFLNPIIFSDIQKSALKNSNFFIGQNEDSFFNIDPTAQSGRVDDWTDLYGAIGGSGDPHYREQKNSVFVTSDFLLHIYHRLLEKEFEYIEQKEFYPRLKKMTDAMLNTSIDGYYSAKSNSQKESFQRLIAYFAVPKTIIDSSFDFYTNEKVGDDNSDSKKAVLANLDNLKDNIPTVSYDTAKQEIELIMVAEEPKSSPIFGKYQNSAGLVFAEDYTQYGPRSHYAKNPILRNYFRSMMWYGRQAFFAKSKELTNDAVNIVLMFNQNNLFKYWEDIYVPTTFFVGESDDLGIMQYQEIIQNNKSLSVGDDLVMKVQEDIKKLPDPQIMSSLVGGDAVTSMSKEELQKETKGFRFMGQRFTSDAFIFSTLTQGDELPDPKTGEKLPSMPTALMVADSFGNKTSAGLLSDWENINAVKSKNVIADRINSLQSYFNSLPEKKWTQNIYWGWLSTLKSLFQEDLDKTGYPNFMKNTDWDKKNLQSFFGSWTELKHDTLLYAKQSYSEKGGGGDEEEKIPPVPKGYVEPNIEFFDRLIPLVKMTEDGLAQRNLLDNVFIGRNDSFSNSLEFFRKIAIAEVNNEKITDDDFEKLRLEAGRLDNIIAPLPNEIRTEDNARSALIADVHTDGVNGEILYEANGIPNYIYVAVKDTNGTRLTKGLVYSYYEFKNPLEKRLTDADWRGWAYGEKEKIPPMADWNKELIK